METKVCRKCNVDKPLDLFNKSKALKDGRQTYCKKCASDYLKAWEKAHPNRSAGRSRWKENSLFCQICSVKSRAKRKGIPFDTDVSDLTVPSVCPILGIPIFREAKQGGPNSPSVDKIIPSLGYVKGNRWIISNRANMIKSSASFEELVLMGKWAQEQLEKNGESIRSGGSVSPEANKIRTNLQSPLVLRIMD